MVKLMLVGAGNTALARPWGAQQQLIPRSRGSTASISGYSRSGMDPLRHQRPRPAPIPRASGGMGAYCRPAFGARPNLAATTTMWIPSLAFGLSCGLLRRLQRPGSSSCSSRLCRRGFAVQLHARATTKSRRVTTAAAAPATVATTVRAEDEPSSKPTRLLLIDGYGLLFAAFYGMKHELRNSRDEPIGALMTVAKQLLAIQRALPSTHCAVMLDNRSEQLVKKQKLPQYKQNRFAAPNELIEQIVQLPALCEGFGVRPISLDGYEADDLIGVYAHEASKHCSVIIVSRDKDLLQLVSDDDQVVVYDPKDLTEAIDSKGVEAKFGIRPDQVPDWLALAGDQSDNVPGVPGIGPERAKRLLQTFGDLEGIFAAAQQAGSPISGVGPKLKQALLEHEQQAIRMREEVLRIPATLPGLVDPTDFKAECEYLGGTPEGQKQMLACCRRFGFNQLHNIIAGGRAPCLPKVGDVTVVEDAAQAAQAMQVLEEHADSHVFAVSIQADGQPICFSVYAGSDVQFADGPRLWVDLQSLKTLQPFKDFFADGRFRKVFHDFSTDCSVLEPFLRLRGFAGDVLHMVRLLNAAMPSTGDSLESLALHFKVTSDPLAPPTRGKGRKAAASELQSSPSTREEWIQYASLAAVTVFRLREAMQSQLQKKRWQLGGPAPEVLPEELQDGTATMWDFYEQYYVPYGKLLSELEAEGVPVDVAELQQQLDQATTSQQGLELSFLQWAEDRIREVHGEDAAQKSNISAMNLASTKQLSWLLYGDTAEAPLRSVGVARDSASNSVAQEELPAPEPEPVQETESELHMLTCVVLKEMCRERGLKVGGRKADLVDRLLNADAPESKSLRQSGKRAKPAPHIYGLGLEPLAEYKTAKGQPQVSQEALVALKEKRAVELRDDGQEAMDTLLQVIAMESLRTGFLQVLIGAATEQSRVHPELNINTETGRLSCRNPNLQNQPVGCSLPIRKVFAAPPGRKLIVADYGQLELRLVAHIANCEPMIQALSGSGDLHSQTAYRMFDEVREAVDAGDVLLEETGDGTDSDLPLVKERFERERHQAKTFNFAMLYGKTAWGFSKDMGVTKAEAEAMIRRWYGAYPEIHRWKEDVKARPDQARTILGRIRPRARPKSKGELQHILRAAVNAPIQGSAADVVMSAMLKLHRSTLLEELGFVQVLQIHDEIILEGPEEAAELALEEVVQIMEDPLPMRLKVPLPVDAKVVDSWHEAKG